MAPSGEWRLIREEARPGALLMALDEVAARTVADGGPRTLRVYSWDPSTLSLGYQQDPSTVDWGYCEREGIDVTRRQTGGGGIYHDRFGDISYSIVAPSDELPGTLLEAYHRLLEPVLDALGRLGIEAGLAEEEAPPLYEPACYLRGLHPAHDVVAGGRKLSGNAQYRQRDAVIQHGSLTYARETDRHLAVFADPPSSTAFEKRVTSIRAECGVDREHAVATLETAFAEWADADVGTWTETELETARRLAEGKYTDPDWVRRRESAVR